MKSTGFTLMEVLVVLVIVGLATSLMAQGLTTTWDNFARLSARDMLMNQSALPKQWFNESVAGAVLYHPNKVVVEGRSDKLSLISVSIPDDNSGIPKRIVWQLRNSGSNTELSFHTETSPTLRIIMHLEGRYSFEFLIPGQGWRSTFAGRQGEVPGAVRIISQTEGIWSLATVLRPRKAEVPAELARFGVYEF